MTGARAGGMAREAADITTDHARHMYGGLAATVLSAIAVAFSGYSLWDATLKNAEIKVFVPRVIYYAAPYNNSNFEIIQVPVTLANEGARTGTVLHMDLAATNPRTGETKMFYAAEFGVWSMERTRTRAYTGFAPVSLAGRTSRTDSILFYTRGEDQKPDQLIRDVGPYRFALTLTLASEEQGVAPKPITVTFDRALPFYDARAFETGTIFMPAPDWQSSSNGAAAP